MSEAPFSSCPCSLGPFGCEHRDSGLCQEEGPPPKCRRQEGGSAGSVCSLHPSVLYRLSGTAPREHICPAQHCCPRLRPVPELLALEAGALRWQE